MFSIEFEQLNIKQTCENTIHYYGYGCNNSKL